MQELPFSDARTRAVHPRGPCSTHRSTRTAAAPGARTTLSHVLRAVAVCEVIAAMVACRAPSADSAKPLPAVPELYGAGLFSTGAWDFFMAFTPDQRRVLFCRADDGFDRYDIYETRLDEDGRWSPPVKPRFAERWSNADPHFSPDGRRVYFISNRPGPGETAEAAAYDIWVAALGPDGAWGDAERLPPPVNDPALDEWSPMVAPSGNLYFGGERPGTRGGSDLWVSRLVGGAYQPPENLGDAINTPGGELEPWITTDERTLIFSGIRRTDNLGGYDLYISHLVDGRWTPARRLPEPINSRASDFNQSISPDGRWLYFSSSRPYSGPLGPRFDMPRDDAAIRGIGSGKSGDIYRVAVDL